MIRFSGRLTASNVSNPYLYLSFDVPSGVTRIDLSYMFSEGSILDLGLLDPSVQVFPSISGFRGWSGSARRTVFVATDEATPGYIPGDITAGSWQVILGLAKIAPEGCIYSVEIRLDTSPRSKLEPTLSKSVVRVGAGWYKGDLQSHSYYSDAQGSVEDLLAVAKDRGLDFLAITDHNTHSHHRKLAELNSSELLLICGEELTTYRGHANVWGIEGWVDFRILGDTDLDTIIEHVHSRGGLFSVNHPKALPNCLGCDWEYAIPEKADSFEVWQGPWVLKNWESLARYEAVLKTGRCLTLVGGSDRHQPGYPDPDPEILHLGSPTTFLELEELSQAAVIKAIRQGRAFVSESPEGPALEFSLGEARMGDTVTAGQSYAAKARVRGARGDKVCWLGSAGPIRETLIEADDFCDSFDWQAEGAYLRLEVVAEASLGSIQQELKHFQKHPKFPRYVSVEDILKHPWRRALSNPVYIQS